jgi:hypothetical protein
VGDPHPGQVLADADQGPLDAARRLGLHRIGVVADVPGLHEPMRRVEHLDGAVDGGRAVRQGRQVRYGSPAIGGGSVNAVPWKYSPGEVRVDERA